MAGELPAVGLDAGTHHDEAVRDRRALPVVQVSRLRQPYGRPRSIPTRCRTVAIRCRGPPRLMLPGVDPSTSQAFWRSVSRGPPCGCRSGERRGRAAGRRRSI
eukprot:5083441-Prymnesium_polylepis.2